MSRVVKCQTCSHYGRHPTTKADWCMRHQRRTVAGDVCDFWKQTSTPGHQPIDHRAAAIARVSRR